MNTEPCRMLGVDFPLLAFNHWHENVVAPVSRWAGFG